MADTTTDRKNRSRLVERYSKNQPDRNWDDENGSEDLAGLAADELDKYDSDRKLWASTLGKDARLADLIQNSAEADDILVGLIETYGDELTEALQSEEGKKKFADAHEKWLKKVADEAEADKVIEENYRKSGETLQAFADAHGLDDEAKAELFWKVHDTAAEVLEGIYTEEAFQAAYNALHYKDDVAKAREDGLVEGRNSKIKRELRESKPAANMRPSLGGQEMNSVTAPESKKKKGLDMFGI